LYGVPLFLEDASGQQLHGDSRNEYGLFGLNQFLGIGNRAFVVRANVNTNDDIDAVRDSWDSKMTTSGITLEILAQNFINEYNDANGLIPADSGYKTTITTSEFISLSESATSDIWDLSTFSPLREDFFDDAGDPSSATAGEQTVNMSLSDQDEVAQVTQVVTNGDNNANRHEGNYFTLHSTTTDYYVWYNLNGGSPATVDPGLAGYTGIPVTYDLDDSATVIANKTRAAINALGGSPSAVFTATNITNTVTITNDVAGDATNAVDGGASPSEATGFVITTNTEGVDAAIYSAVASGLANDATAYTATILVDGTANVVSIVGSTAQTYADVITQLDINLTGATSALVSQGGSPALYDIVITSSTTGATSTISITDGATIPLFATLTDFDSFADPVDGVSPDSALLVYANGYSQPSTGTYSGLEGIANNWTSGGTVSDEWTPAEAEATLNGAADDFKFTVEFKNGTSLGANDSARRATIVTALQATVNSNTEVRSENFEYNLILCPGYHELADEMLALSAFISNEALVIGETPMNMDPQEVVAWAGTTGRQSSTDIAYYYPHCEASNLDGVNVFVGASGTALRTYAYSDEVSQLWFAPAGTRRGLITGVTEIGYVTGDLGSATTIVPLHANLGQRDDMYKYFTNLNPLVFFPGRGLLVWGQKTSAPAASALDRVSVSRLIMYIRRQLRKNTLAFVFEPNDQLTRDNLKSAVDGFLGDIVIKRGLYDFATVCDESNNTPDRIDRNEMYIDVALKPVKAAEFIYIPIRVVATGAEI